MNRKLLTKTLLAAIVAFVSAGGSCYDLAEPATSEKMVAERVVTYYTIVDSVDNDEKCVRTVSSWLIGDRKIFQVVSPARLTFNGSELSTVPKAQNKFDCQAETADFVLTDNQGGTKSDFYNISKIKMDFPAEIDSQSDLRVPVEFDPKYEYETDGDIESVGGANLQELVVLDAKDKTELNERLSGIENKDEAAYLLLDEKILFVPKTVLQKIKPGEIVLAFNVKQTITKERPAAIDRKAIIFQYDLKFKLRLK